MTSVPVPEGAVQAVRRPRGRPVATPAAVLRRRQQIVEAAYAVFAERGYHAAGIADIAERLRIGHGTFYRYFENKRDILDHVVDYGVNHILKLVIGGGVAEATTLGEFRSQLAALGNRLFEEVAVREPRLPKLILFEATSIDDELTERVFTLLESITAVLRSLFDNGVKCGFLRPDLDVAAVSRAANGAVLSGLLIAARGPFTEIDRVRYVAAMVS
ncbi:MAG TPA: TetR/AcrR family transcriptional regulator, partial [Jatrophihabitantaceae bacterium]|nr:TetR/AcrR family transcriptional regulator [Jatrophihabitantaceae bacterium]